MASATWRMPPEFRNAVGETRDRVDLAIQKTLLAGLIRIEGALKTKFLSGSPVARRSGNLSRAVFHEPQAVGNMTPPYVGYVFVGLEAPYAVYLEEGTGVFHEPDPHEPWIVEHPVDKMPAYFEIGGDEVFSRREVHYGIEPRRFMELALQQETPAIIADGMKRVTAALQGTAA